MNSTVFSHIIQKRFSGVNEDVATDALAYILESSENARAGFLKMLRGIEADLPELRFWTQQSDDGKRPDMWGLDQSGRRVYVENKFWAGLTDNQPVEYLHQLAKFGQPTLLLFVVPAIREQTIWQELRKRLESEEVGIKDRDCPSGIVKCAETELGPIISVTSWVRLISAIRIEAADDAAAMADIEQLASLCDAAESDAFVPFAAEAVTDQRTPAFIMQVSDVVQESVQRAVTDGLLDLGGLRPQASWHRTGRYIRFREPGVVAWIGLHLKLWRKYGNTPIWLTIPLDEFQASPMDIQNRLESWASNVGLVTDARPVRFRLGLDLVIGEDKDAVAKSIAENLHRIGEALSEFPLGQSQCPTSGLDEED